MGRRLLPIILVIALCLILQPVFGLVQNANSSTSQEINELNKKIKERKDKIDQLESNIDKYKSDIKQKQLEGVSLKNQLSILNNYIEKAKIEIALTEENIKKVQLEINALKLEIEDKEKKIAKQKNIVTKMIRDINKEQQKDYLEILLTNSSFSEFYNQVQHLENIYQDLGKSVKTLRLAKEDLDKKKNEQEKQKKSYEDYKQKSEHKKQELLDQTNIKERLLRDTYYSEQKFTVLLTSLRQQYKTIEDEIRSYEREVQKKLEAQDKISSSGDVVLTWPTTSRYITSYFHDPDYPYRHVFEHSGIDIGISQGTPLKAAAAGYVARARGCYSSSCYSYVLLVHTGNLSTLYGHMSSITAQADQFVNRGDIIGYSGGAPGTVGAGPFVTGPHLHFETRLNGIPVNPLGYLN